MDHENAMPSCRGGILSAYNTHGACDRVLLHVSGSAMEHNATHRVNQGKHNHTISRCVRLYENKSQEGNMLTTLV